MVISVLPIFLFFDHTNEARRAEGTAELEEHIWTTLWNLQAYTWRKLCKDLASDGNILMGFACVSTHSS